MSDSIRLGIAGGGVGERHAEAFGQVEGVSLTAIADLDPERRDALKQRFGFMQDFDSCKAMIASGILDAIVICLPTDRNERSISDAFDAGLHVLCESPPARNASEMSRIVSAAGFCGKTYMWSRPQRFSPLLQEARRLASSGKLGDLYRSEGVTHWAWWPYGDDDWRGSIEQGGGALLHLGIHVLDSLWQAMDCPDPVEAMAAGHNLFAKERFPDPFDAAPDSAFGMIRFKNGASLSLSAMAAGHVAGPATDWGAPSETSLKLFGSQASLDLVQGQKTIVADTQAETHSYASPISESECYLAQAQEFVDAIRDEREPLNNGKQGLALMKMIDALAESAKEKKAIPIKSARSLDDLFGGL